MTVEMFTLNFVAGWIAGLVTGLVTGLIVARASHVWRVRDEDRREREREKTELRGAARVVLSEIERNGEEIIRLIENVMGGPIEPDAHKALRADVWKEEHGRLHQLMPPGDFDHLQTYYRELEKLQGDLRDYHSPSYTKNERPKLLENLQRQAEELGGYQQKAINAASKYLNQ